MNTSGGSEMGCRANLWCSIMIGEMGFFGELINLYKFVKQ